jgi:hypothetical protein
MTALQKAMITYGRYKIQFWSRTGWSFVLLAKTEREVYFTQDIIKVTAPQQEALNREDV